VSRKLNRALPHPTVEEEGVRMSSEDRKRQLIQVAIRLFSRKGFSGTTTKEIALAAGVTEALIFRHFPSKDDLYAAILDFKASEARVKDTLDELGEYARRRDDEGLFGALGSKILEHYDRDLDFMRLMFYSALEGHALAQRFCENQFAPIHEFLREYVTLRQREGAFRRCNPTAAVSAFIGMYVHHSLANRLLEFKVLDITDEEAVDTFTRLFLDGIRSGAAAKQPSAKEPATKERSKNPSREKSL
jgi:AcrR family transcriptional regulator